MKNILLALICLTIVLSCETNPIPEDMNKNEKYPYLEDVYGSMYKELMMSETLEDTKLFADAVPKRPIKDIRLDFRKRKNDVGFDRMAFMKANWVLPEEPIDVDTIDRLPISEHIEKLWSKLTKPVKEKEEYSTYIPIPNPHVITDTRDREINYWESYFIIEGLLASGKTDVAKGMIDNFKYLIEEFGYIPQGNRSYFISRSNPPMFTDMIRSYIDKTGEDIWDEYIPSIEREYEFWMRGAGELSEKNLESEHLVQVTDKIIANRYFDSRHAPRAEDFFQDSHRGGYRYVRAASESGWGRCSRLMSRPDRYFSLDAPNIIAVDLNSILHNMETTLRDYHQKKGNSEKVDKYEAAIAMRNSFIYKLSWSDSLGVFFDFRHEGFEMATGENFKPFTRYTPAMLYPLFYNIATDEQAEKTVSYVTANLIKAGGIATSTQQQKFDWDADWGHPALQWISVKALDNYGYKKEAKDLASRWVSLNEKVYQNTGKMLDKYNVENLNIENGGAKYDRHDGYGVTNAVYMALKAYLAEE